MSKRAIIRNSVVLLLCALSFSVSAQISAEYYFDTDPGFGRGTPLGVSAQGTVSSAINVSALSDGMHVLAVRAKSSAGKWSTASHSLLHKHSAATLNDSIKTVYYYWDEDATTKTELPVTRLGNNVEVIADLNGLSQFENEEPHYLFIEAHTSRGYVSLSCFEVVRDMSVGMEQLTVNELKIYPVPFSTQLFVETMGEGDKIVLTDMTGRKLFTTTKYELNGSGLNVSHLASGTYLLTVYQGEKVITKVVVKQ